MGYEAWCCHGGTEATRQREGVEKMFKSEGRGPRYDPTSLVKCLVMGAVVALAVTPAWGDDASTRRRLDELERKQQELSDQLKKEDAAPDLDAAGQKRVGEVERRQGILVDEVRRLREALTVPETAELKGQYGLGPAASKVYGVQRGLSIGGYGETNFRKVTKDIGGLRDEFDFLRFVIYTGYKFNDWIVLNTETEFEHASTASSISSGSGEVSVEFAYLDFLLHEKVNVRAGLVLVPMGFINEIHEPPFFHGNVRPEVERELLPSTWRANGAGLFGELLPGLQYRTYGLTGLNAKGFRNTNIRSGRQSGNRERAEDWAWVARLDYAFAPSSLVGGSVYLGDSGQSLSYGSTDPAVGLVKESVFTQIYEAHAQYRAYGLETRALFALIDVGDADQLSRDSDITGTNGTKGRPIADTMLGWYLEAAYDILPLLIEDTTQYLAPWLRYSRVDTQNSVPDGFTPDLTQDRDAYELGLTYKPIPQVAIKADYRILDAKRGTRPDELRLGLGFVF